MGGDCGNEWEGKGEVRRSPGRGKGCKRGFLDADHFAAQAAGRT